MARILRVENPVDGVELHGVLAGHSRHSVIIHVHGLAGNFYENSFVHTFVETAERSSVSFLSVNTRAHDYLADAYSASTGEVLARGGARSPLDEIRTDLAAWVGYARSEGFRRIVLQGHSVGALYVIDFLSSAAVAAAGDIVGIVIASPADMVGLQEVSHGAAGAQEFLNKARAMVAEGRELDFMPPDALDGYLIDARTYLEMFSPGGQYDFMNLRTDEESPRLGAIEAPVLAFFGGGAEACPVEAEDALRRLSAQLRRSAKVSTCVIGEAGHSYRGFEQDVVETVLTWAGDLVGE